MEKFKRYLIFLAGLFISSLGVSFVTRANLGTSPISSIPYVLSLRFSWTLGNFTIAFSILLILLQLAILRKDFKFEHVLQIPVSIIFGYFIDFTMLLLQNYQPEAYYMKLFGLLIGCVILAFGVYLEVLANVVMLPEESFVRAIVMTWGTNFGNTKVVFDATMSICAAGISLIFFHRLEGVREGTLICALLVGFIARLFSRILSFIEPLIFPTTVEKEVASSSTRPGYVISISRQYGSGGHELAEEIATELGYDFYDSKTSKLTADHIGYNEDFISNHEEKMTNSLLYDLVNEMYAYTSSNPAPKDAIYKAEAQVITEIAQNGNSVIVGRLADYVLRNNNKCFKVFLTADLSHRIDRIMKRENLSHEDAKLRIQKEDKLRSSNYHYYTKRIWGLSSNYNISIDTSLGMDYAKEAILTAFEQFQKSNCIK